jgi:hypothetical protein
MEFFIFAAAAFLAVVLLFIFGIRGSNKITAAPDLMPLPEQKTRLFALYTENVHLLPKRKEVPVDAYLNDDGTFRKRFDNPVEDFWHNTDLYPEADLSK